MRGWMEGMYEHSRRSIYPCQSTGLWYARASAPVRLPMRRPRQRDAPASLLRASPLAARASDARPPHRVQVIAFFSEMYDYLLARPNEWEQKAYQLLVMRFLIGLGDDFQ